MNNRSPSVPVKLFKILPLLAITLISSIALGDPSDKLRALVWMEYSAEYEALTRQAFNLARDRLAAEIKEAQIQQTKNKKKKNKKDVAITWTGIQKAVVVDIDETILLNTPLDFKRAQENLEGFDPKEFDSWVELAQAKPVPGAVEFLQYADANGYKVFYVSNRSNSTGLVATRKNLVAAGFPVASDANDNSQFLLMDSEFNKESRRNFIQKSHEISLLMGDNLEDFDSAFDSKPSEDRKANVTKYAKEFGRKWIVLPNPIYGTWEKALDKDVDALVKTNNLQAPAKRKVDGVSFYKFIVGQNPALKQ